MNYILILKGLGQANIQYLLAREISEYAFSLKDIYIFSFISLWEKSPYSFLSFQTLVGYVDKKNLEVRIKGKEYFI